MRLLLALLIAGFGVGMQAQKPIAVQSWLFGVKPEKGVLKCEVAESNEALKANLQRLGSTGLVQVPVEIDWKKECAVVIAPGYWYPDREISISGIVWDGTHYVVRWGMFPVNAGTFSLQARAIVVKIDHSYHAGDRLRCQGPYEPEDPAQALRSSHYWDYGNLFRPGDEKKGCGKPGEFCA